jgi:hypothetical protein
MRLTRRKVLPDTTFGPPVSHKHQGNPSTSQLVTKLAKATREEFEGMANFLPPREFSFLKLPKKFLPLFHSLCTTVS